MPIRDRDPVHPSGSDTKQPVFVGRRGIARPHRVIASLQERELVINLDDPWKRWNAFYREIDALAAEGFAVNSAAAGEHPSEPGAADPVVEHQDQSPAGE